MADAMKTREQEAEEREKAAGQRMCSAERIRGVGSLMMITGGLAVAVIMSINIVEPLIPNWLRGNGFTVAGMLALAGVIFYVGGRVSQFHLEQAADDREEREAQHDEVMAELRDIKRNQAVMLSRPGAGDAKANGHHVEDPSVVKLDDIRLLKRIDDKLRDNREN